MSKKNTEIIWKPNEDFLNNSNVAILMKKNNLSNHSDLIKWSQKDSTLFTKAILEDMEIKWYQNFQKVLDLSKGFPWAKWFTGGKINIVYNCIDKHLSHTQKDHSALIWEGDDSTKRTFTYEQLSFEVSKLANAKKIKKILFQCREIQPQTFQVKIFGARFGLPRSHSECKKDIGAKCTISSLTYYKIDFAN